MKKKIAIVLLVLLLPLCGLAAQQADTYTLLSFDIGYGPTVGLTNTTLGAGQMFGINVRPGGPFSVGAAYMSNALGANFGALKLKFDIVSMARAVLTLGAVDDGQNNTPITYDNIIGLGFELVPFKRQVGGIFTEFKLAVDYMALPTALGDGGFNFILAAGIGF